MAALPKALTGKRRARNPARSTPWAAVLVLLLLAATLARAEKLDQLKPQGYVNDFAGVLSADARSKLTALCGEVEQKTRAQIAVVTIHTLDGDSVEDFATRLYQQWGIGPKTDNRGVLILLAVDDHKYRVEVGYGLEPILPDGKVGGFGRAMVPALRRGDYDGALLELTGSVASVIAQASGVTLTQAPPPAALSGPRAPNFSPIAYLAFAVICLLLFGGFGCLLPFGLGSRRRRYPGLWWGGGPWIGGGFGGGGFSGGGFGGGGGGGFGGFGGGLSGGGGASGSW